MLFHCSAPQKCQYSALDYCRYADDAYPRSALWRPRKSTPSTRPRRCTAGALCTETRRPGIHRRRCQARHPGRLLRPRPPRSHRPSRRRWTTGRPRPRWPQRPRRPRPRATAATWRPCAADGFSSRPSGAKGYGEVTKENGRTEPRENLQAVLGSRSVDLIINLCIT